MAAYISVHHLVEPPSRPAPKQISCVPRQQASVLARLQACETVTSSKSKSILAYETFYEYVEVGFKPTTI